MYNYAYKQSTKTRIAKAAWSVCFNCGSRRYSATRSHIRCKPCGVEWNAARDEYDHTPTVLRQREENGYIDFAEQWAPSPDCTMAGWVDDNLALPFI